MFTRSSNFNGAARNHLKEIPTKKHVAHFEGHLKKITDRVNALASARGTIVFAKIGPEEKSATLENIRDAYAEGPVISVHLYQKKKEDAPTVLIGTYVMGFKGKGLYLVNDNSSMASDNLGKQMLYHQAQRPTELDQWMRYLP